MRHIPAKAFERLSVMTTHCSKASNSSIPLTFSPGFSTRRTKPSFCLSVMCIASSCMTVTVCFVARQQMHFWATMGNSRIHRWRAFAIKASSGLVRSLMSAVFSFLISTSGSSAGLFLAATAAGMMTRFNDRNDFRSLLSKSTIHRSPCQLRTSPHWPLYFCAFAKPTMVTLVPGSSSAGLRFPGLTDKVAPVLMTTFTRSGFSGFGPQLTTYCSFSSGFAARPVTCACDPHGNSDSAILMTPEPKYTEQPWPNR
mmetsp:Transcript_41894/g.96108  ORF Transcript_41894/g.96108 Transcript_41894/m.96108 type:complete len:255 (+) Transcript_41894:108-872(+)